MNATHTVSRAGFSEVEPPLSGATAQAPASLGGRMTLAHRAAARGDTWAVTDDAGNSVFSVGRRPFGGSRITVRDRDGTDVATIGERVLSLLETHTIWRGGQPYARVYRPTRWAFGDRWFVEIGEGDGWVVLTDGTGLRVLSAGREVAKLGCRDGRGMLRCVDAAPGVDVSLVLCLAALLHTLEDVGT